MGEATRSSRGRNTRPPVSSRRRGTSLYDRLEEARLRRHAVLANQKVADAATSANEPTIIRSESNIVDESSKQSATKRIDHSHAESTRGLPLVAPPHRRADSLRPSWFLFFPGIAVGFVLALAIIGWTTPPRGSTTAVGAMETIDPTKRAPRAFAAKPTQIVSNGESPLVTYKVRPQAKIVLAPGDIDTPTAAAWPGSFKAKSPAQIAPATVELPPLIDAVPPERYMGPPFVLNKVPPARPDAIEPSAMEIPGYSRLDIVLHVPNQVRQSDAESLIVAATGAGFDIATIRPAAFTISRTNIRYFHDRDAVAAGALASATNGRLRDFTGFQPPPDPGVIEVWLEGRGTPAREQQDTAERPGIFEDLRAELRRIFRQTDG